jgi:hypothetical protein
VTPITDLRLTLAINGLFSTLSGLGMLAIPSLVQQRIIQLPIPLIVAIGIGLGLFGLAVLSAAARPHPGYRNVLLISFLDFGWVLLTAPLALTPLAPTPTAKAIVLAIAAAVGLFAILQIRTVDQSIKLPNGLRKICFTVVNTSSAATIWQRLADLGNIANYIPDLAESRLVNGTNLAPGTTRECRDVANQKWQETCTEVTENSFTLRFHTEAPDYPYPLQNMHGGWIVEDHPQGSKLTVWWTAEAKSKLPPSLLFLAMAAKAERSVPVIVHCLSEGQKTIMQKPKRLPKANFC